jgi:hypothetical protein
MTEIKKLNCWEYLKYGREEDGKNTKELVDNCQDIVHKKNCQDIVHRQLLTIL